MKARIVLFVSMTILLSRTTPADQNPATDGVSNLTIPYHGILEINQDPYPESVGMTFFLYDGDAQPAVFEQTFGNVPLYNGRFSVELGPQDDSSRNLADVIAAADDLYLEIALIIQSTTVDLNNRQRLLPAPYAHWSRKATDLEVAQSATIHDSLTVDKWAVFAGDQGTAGRVAVSSNGLLSVGSGGLNVTGTTSVAGLAAANANIGGGAAAGGFTVYNNGSTVVGNSSKTDSLAVHGADYTGTTAPLTVNGTLHLDQNTVENTNGDLYLNWHHDGRVRMGGGMTVAGDASVAGQLTVGSTVISKLEISAAVTASINCTGETLSTNQLLTPTATSICFLTKMALSQDPDGDPQLLNNRCEIDASGGSWRLTAACITNDSDETANTSCTARCLVWN